MILLKQQPEIINENHILSDNYLDIATRIGYGICKEAFTFNSKCNWIGLEHDHSIPDRPELISTNLNTSVYNGTAGIALFLNRLFSATKISIFKDVAIKAMNHALSETDIVDNNHNYWSGQLGINLTALEIAENNRDDEMYDKAIIHLKSIFNQREFKGIGVDILGGCAGAIISVLQYLPMLPKALQKSATDYIINQGTHLSNLAIEKKDKTYWQTERPPQQYLLGYGHGISGIAHALIELGYFIHEERYIDLAHRAIKFENTHFDETERNWPDLRDSKRNSYMNAWCHGAMGIGLSRIRCFELTKSEYLIEDVDHCLSHYDSTLSWQNMSACQCHGISGNMELLLEASKVIDMPSLLNKIEQTAEKGVKHINENRAMINGLQNHYQIPGLMNGLAGIGYFFLRMARPTFPSILLMKKESKNDYASKRA